MRSGIVLTVGLAVAAGCGSSEESATTVSAAFYPLAYAADRLLPAAEVENVTPAGAEPHDLELTPRDVEAVRGADAVLYFGSRFMPALEDAVAGDDDATDLLAGERLRRARPGESGRDPHLWLDPLRYAAIVRKIGESLGAPEGRTGELVAELERLHEEFRRRLASCRRRELVTSHAAFGYLADAYGLRQTSLAGLAPEAEPSARAIEGLVEEVEKVGATTVFFETLVSPKLAETVAREAGVETAVLNPLEGLTEEEIENGADYFSVMRENLAALREGLGCR